MGLKTLEDAKNLMLKGLEKLCEYIGEFRKNKENELYDNAVKYIEKNYFENITYQKLSQQLNCSAQYLKKLFKTRAGKTLQEYLSYVRINAAKKLIVETNMSDEAIALNVGYSDLNTFRNAFRNLEGYMVGDFRFIKKRNVKQ